MTDAALLEIIHAVTRGVEVIGILVILGGALVAGLIWTRDAWTKDAMAAYRALRANLGRSILVGLELLVAADIINTVAIEPTLDSCITLGGIATW